MTAVEMIDAAQQGRLDVLVSSGGNYLEVLPDPAYVGEALERVPTRVHMDIVLSSQMLVDPADTVVLLPAATRYEMPGGVTETTTERRVIFSPEIPGPRIGEARPEWEVFVDLAKRVRPELVDKIHFDSTAATRVVPLPDHDVPEDRFLVTTRRGKQFNSMVHELRDALTGAIREAVMVGEEDAARLGIGNGSRWCSATPSASSTDVP